VEFRCQVCGRAALGEIEEFRALPRITSDCKPFPAGGRLAECAECGATQKLPTPEWLAEIGRIYAAYTPYHQAEGVEQIVLDSESGELRRRSEVIVSRLKAARVLGESGRALDVGCGSGATLKVLSREAPRWRLFGNELDDRNHDHLTAIPGFERLYACPPSGIDGSFDLVTSIHSLEHFPAPYSVLEQIRPRLAPEGRLFVQLYNSAQNPFDLVIADHLMHFTPRTLARIVGRAGYDVLAVETGWVAKELSLLAGSGPGSADVDRYPEMRGRIATVRWLSALISQASELARGRRTLGVFGTSIAATWLAGALPGRVAFFVDEDPLRQNREHMGARVLAPRDVPAGAPVLLALVPQVAANVRKRLAPLGIEFVSPVLLQ